MTWKGYDPLAECSWADLRGELGGEIGSQRGSREATGGNVDVRRDAGDLGGLGHRPMREDRPWQLTPALPVKAAVVVVDQLAVATAPPAGIARTVPLSHTFHGRARLAVDEKNARDRQAARAALHTAVQQAEDEDMANAETEKMLAALAKQAADTQAQLAQLTKLMMNGHATPAPVARPSPALPPPTAPAPRRKATAGDAVFEAVVRLMRDARQLGVNGVSGEKVRTLLYRSSGKRLPEGFPARLSDFVQTLRALTPRLAEAGITVICGQRISGEMEFGIYRTEALPQRFGRKTPAAVESVEPSPVVTPRPAGTAARPAPAPEPRRVPALTAAAVASGMVVAPDERRAFIALASRDGGWRRLADALPLIARIPGLARLLPESLHGNPRLIRASALLQAIGSEATPEGRIVMRLRYSVRQWRLDTSDSDATARQAAQPAVPRKSTRSGPRWMLDIAVSRAAAEQFAALAIEFSLHGERRLGEAIPIIEMVPELAAPLARAVGAMQRGMVAGIVVRKVAEHDLPNGSVRCYKLSNGLSLWNVEQASAVAAE